MTSLQAFQGQGRTAADAQGNSMMSLEESHAQALSLKEHKIIMVLLMMIFCSFSDNA